MNENNSLTQFQQFISENKYQIESDLHVAAADFLFQHSGISIPTGELGLDNHWHYLANDKLKKKGYAGQITRNKNGVPYLSLTYNDFKEGSKTFPSEKNFEIVNNLYEDWKAGGPGIISYSKVDTAKLEKERIAQAAKQARTEERNKHENARACQKAIYKFNALPSLNKYDSLYLQRANINFAHKLFKFDKQYKTISIAIKNAKNDAVIGVQWIDSNGKKRFNKGLPKKDGFGCVPIGFNEGGPGFPSKIYLCEGVKDAIVLNHCTGIPAISTLDSGNMPNIAGVIKTRYPDSELIIVSDNDKAGMQASMNTAQSIGASICLPTEKDIADTFLTNDDHGVISTLAITHTFDFIKVVLGFQFYNPVIFNERYVTETNIQYKTIEFIKENIASDKGGIIAIKAAQGSGKTTLIKEVFKFTEANNIPSILTTPLKKLTGENVSNLRKTKDGESPLNISSYTDKSISEFCNTIGITYNSLFLERFERFIQNCKVLVIDEVSHFFKRHILGSAVDPREKDELFKKFVGLLQKLGITIILLDADLDSYTLDKFSELSNISKENIYLWIGTFKIGSLQSADVVTGKQSEGEWIKKADLFNERKKNGTLSKGELPPLMEMDNRKKANEIAVGRDYLVIDRDFDFEILAGYKDGLTGYLKEQNKPTIFTPAVALGVDINEKIFDITVHCSYHGVQAPVSFIQMMRRYRIATHYVIGIAKNFLAVNAKKPCTYEDVRREQIAKILELTKRMIDDEKIVTKHEKDLKLSCAQNTADNLQMEMTAMENAEKVDYDRKIVELLKADGVTITESNKDNAEGVAEDRIEFGKQFIKEELAQNVIDAPDIEGAELSEVIAKSQRGGGLTKAENAQLIRYKMKKNFGLEGSEITSDHVDFYSNGGDKAIKDLQSYVTPEQIMNDLDKTEVDVLLLSDKRALSLKQYFKQKILDTVFERENGQRSFNKPVENWDYKHARKTIKLLWPHRDAFNGCKMGRRLDEDALANPTKWLNEVLNNILKIKMKGKRIRIKENVRHLDNNFYKNKKEGCRTKKDNAKYSFKTVYTVNMDSLSLKIISNLHNKKVNLFENELWDGIDTEKLAQDIHDNVTNGDLPKSFDLGKLKALSIKKFEKTRDAVQRLVAQGLAILQGDVVEIVNS